MSAAEALQAARAAGVELRLDGDDLVLEASAPPLAAILDLLSGHKASIVALLRPGRDGWSAEDWQAHFDERAGIAEYDGGLPREWAEGLAKLCTMPPPAGYTPRRWSRLVNDAGRFADRWAAQAAGLGWSVLDVFGVNPRAPDARYDGMGLVPMLNGAEAVAILPGAARVGMGSGGELIYLRRPRVEAVAVWELGP